MKVLTIIGTRPELIRLCLIIKKLDRVCNQVLVHTGQNYDANLNDIFMRDLGIRKPDYFLGAKGSFGQQIALILEKLEKIIIKEKPERFLVLGDTNSSLGAIIAKRLGIPVYHMEAGNRCYDKKVPEEVNRAIIDHTSDVLLPYTQNSKQNLLAEGVEPRRIFVTGNPIYEVLTHFLAQIDASKILAQLSVKPQRYFLATLHRQENVDDSERLAQFVSAFNQLAQKYQRPVIWSVHPHTKKQLDMHKFKLDKSVKPVEPLGLFDFAKLEKNAFVVISDSGTVQEECAIYHVRSVTLRDTTERQETLEAGSNILSGARPEQILLSVKTILDCGANWQPPQDYLVKNVSDIIVKIVVGYIK